MAGKFWELYCITELYTINDKQVDNFISLKHFSLTLLLHDSANMFSCHMLYTSHVFGMHNGTIGIATSVSNFTKLTTSVKV